MKIELTREQYLEVLKNLDACAMAREGIREYKGKKLNGKEYKLRDYFLSFAPEFGLEKVNFNRHDWMDDFFEQSFDIIDEYAEMEMWEKLAWKLAVLQYDRKYGEQKNSKEERFIKINEIYDKILDEFEENGLENVKIKGIVD